MVPLARWSDCKADGAGAARGMLWAALSARIIDYVHTRRKGASGRQCEKLLEFFAYAAEQLRVSAVPMLPRQQVESMVVVARIPALEMAWGGS
eukprot:1029116-Lingulodinium_polyedra.AAC.1